MQTKRPRPIALPQEANQSQPPPKESRFAMFGGFLGAGKTTAILQFAQWLGETRQWRVGIITNDQANGLVDTALANGGQFAVREIGGGCFCCKSESLVDAMGSFSASVQPQVLIGEPVGSCTDLVSTVLGPLRSIYRTEYELSPLSILVDPFRAGRIVMENGTAGGGFSEDVHYIYRKQLEEAEIIVVNKCDVVDRRRLTRLCATLKENYPKAEILRVSARTGTGLEEWWELILSRRHAAERYMPVDYQVYADGEARLGWVNGEYEIVLAPALRRAPKDSVAIRGNRLLEMVVEPIKNVFREKGIEVAHLKIALMASSTDAQELAAIQWVRTSAKPEITRSLAEPFTTGRMLLNLRAEADPNVLTAIIEKALQSIADQVQIRKREYAAFKPAPPNPTHRMTNEIMTPGGSARVSKSRKGRVVAGK
jgi:G3E family GTPase